MDLWPSTFTFFSIVANYCTQVVMMQYLYVEHNDSVNKTLICALLVTLSRHCLHFLSCHYRPDLACTIMSFSIEVWHDI